MSFVSADFHQMKISCGPEPIPKSIHITKSDLELSETGDLSIELIFAKGIKGDFYDTEQNIETGKREEMSKSD